MVIEHEKQDVICPYCFATVCLYELAIQAYNEGATEFVRIAERVVDLVCPKCKLEFEYDIDKRISH